MQMIRAYSLHTGEDGHSHVTSGSIVVSGALEFVTHGGESFIIHPGEILVATDTTGSGHKWRLIDDQPWKRLYVAFKEGGRVNFRPDGTP
jgi:quercetin dioxygenase-like cupin family protein